MKILHVNTFAAGGGAARAAARLRQGLHEIGIKTELLVQAPIIGSAPDIHCKQTFFPNLSADLRRHLDALPLRFTHRKPVTSFSPAVVPDRFPERVADLKPDLVHLHWLGAGFCRLESLARIDRPLVWTLHDMWAFTGGCFYAGDCTRYRERCGACPQLGSAKESDLSRHVWNRKAHAWRNLDLTIVTPSRWMADCAGRSPLLKNFRIEVIPNGIETDIYTPLDQRSCRERLNLPTDKKLVLFGAINATSDQRKGFHLLQPVLQKLGQSGWQQQTELLVYGASKSAAPLDLGLKTHYLGYLHDDESLAVAYSAADLVVAPSLEDNLPNVVVEALSCGTPCAAFDIGGMPDMIDHQVNGYIAKAFDIEDLSSGIKWLLENSGSESPLRANARTQAVKKFTLETVARQHEELYWGILNTDRPRLNRGDQ
jgi:glycosyltransferase involved in cell wall biosynthesis